MKRGRFPQRIKRGSCVVTIYKTPTKGYASFTVAHYDTNGKLCRRMFSDFEQARHVAEDTAERFAGGASEAHVLTGQELLIYRRAMEALKSVCVPLDMAAIHYAQSVANGNGSTGNIKAALVAGAVMSEVKPMTVSEVVDELLAIKKTKGRSALYLTDLRIRLTRFAKFFRCPLCEITSNDIDRFLESLEISAAQLYFCKIFHLV